jgi:hypothetical protein
MFWTTRLRRTAPVLTLAACLSACGGTSPPPQDAAEPAPVAEEAPLAEPEAPSAEPEESDEAAAVEPESSSSDEEPAEKEKRDVIYKIMGGELSVEVEGVTFVPKAEPVRRKGGWGVRLKVKATAKGEDSRHLLSPEGGPLMVAAKVSGGQQGETIADERKGDGEKVIMGGESIDFSREWPEKNRPGLTAGQSLELHVGLWGLGPDAAGRRPVRKLFLVKMTVGKDKPQPVVSPPQ